MAIGEIKITVNGTLHEVERKSENTLLVNGRTYSTWTSTPEHFRKEAYRLLSVSAFLEREEEEKAMGLESKRIEYRNQRREFYANEITKDLRYGSYSYKSLGNTEKKAIDLLVERDMPEFDKTL
jgi:hypothetical protein